MMHGSSGPDRFAGLNAWASAPRFYFLEAFNEQLIELGVVDAVMGVPMTIGTYPDHVARAVGPGVGKPVHVVALNVASPVGAFERAFSTAMFAMAIGASQHVVTNIAASREDASHNWNPLWCRFCGFKRTPPQRLKIDLFVGRHGLYLLDITCDFPHTTQFKNDRVAHIAYRVWRAFVVMALVYHFALEANAARYDREEENCFSTIPGLDYRKIAVGHLHIVELTLAKILKDAIIPPSVVIAVWVPFLASEDENQGVCCRGNDAASLLSIVARMDVLASIVDATDFKTVRQVASPPLDNALMGCKGFTAVKGRR